MENYQNEKTMNDDIVAMVSNKPAEDNDGTTMSNINKMLHSVLKAIEMLLEYLNRMKQSADIILSRR